MASVTDALLGSEPISPDVYTTPRGPTLKGYLPGGRAGLDAFSALPGYEQNFIREQGRSPTLLERETGVWDVTPQDPFRLPATAPPGQYYFNMPVVPGFNPDGTPIDYMQGGLYQTGLDPEIEARIQEDARRGFFDVNERSVAQNVLLPAFISGGISGTSAEEMQRHRDVTDALASMTQERRFQTPAGAMTTKGPGGYLQLSGQDIGERSSFHPKVLSGLGAGYQGLSEMWKALRGRYAGVADSPVETALSDAIENALGVARSRDPDAPTVQEQAYIPPQFREPNVDYTPATPIRNVARTHLSYQNVPVLEDAERIRMRVDAQDPLINSDGTITYLTDVQAMQSDVQRALDRAGRIGPTPPVTAPEAQLQAITELAQTDPTIAARYTTPGSQDLIDIATQVESFANIPETPWTPPAPVIPDIVVPPPARDEPEPQVEDFSAIQEADRSRQERERKAEVKKAASAARKKEVKREAATKKKAAEQKAKLDSASKKALEAHMKWMETQSKRVEKEEKKRAKRYAGGTGGALMWT